MIRTVFMHFACESNLYLEAIDVLTSIPIFLLTLRTSRRARRHLLLSSAVIVDAFAWL